MIDAYLVDDFIFYAHRGHDKYGEPLVPEFDVYNIKGKIDYKTRLVRNIKGEEVISTALVYLSFKLVGTIGRHLTHEDRIQLAFESFDHAILRVDEPKAFSGPHYEVYIA